LSPENCVAISVEPRPVESLVASAEALCESLNERFTPLRRQVFRTIAESSGPISAYRILDRLLDSGLGSGPPTVYRVLEFLQRLNLIHRVESLNAFVACMSPERHHTCQFLICTSCGTTAEMEAESLLASMSGIASGIGFSVNTAVLELKGVCRGCRDVSGALSLASA
jgi:Fur family zinc uptake transcriptional regulator